MKYWTLGIMLSVGWALAGSSGPWLPLPNAAGVVLMFVVVLRVRKIRGRGL